MLKVVIINIRASTDSSSTLYDSDRSSNTQNTHPTLLREYADVEFIKVGYLNTDHTSKIITESSNKRNIVPIAKAPNLVDFNIRRSSQHRRVSLIGSTDNRKNVTPTLLREPPYVEIMVREAKQGPTSETLKLRKWKTPFSFQRTPPQPTSLFIFSSNKPSGRFF